MSDMPNIALIGRAGAGKSTVRAILVNQYRYYHTSFADPLKDIAYELWGSSARADRSKLQRLGMAVREIDPDAWVALALRHMDESKSWPVQKPWVIDDCRFENEFFALKERGFLVIRVDADEPTRESRLLANGKLQDVADLNHISETTLDWVHGDFYLWNGGGKDHEDLALELHDILSIGHRRVNA